MTPCQTRRKRGSLSAQTAIGLYFSIRKPPIAMPCGCMAWCTRCSSAVAAATIREMGNRHIRLTMIELARKAKSTPALGNVLTRAEDRLEA